MLSDRRLSSRSRTRKGKRHQHIENYSTSTEFENFVAARRPEVVRVLKLRGYEGRQLVRERNRLLSEMYKSHKKI